MRECIYCGRTLEKGEKCTCAMSEAKRREKEGNTSEQTKTANDAKEKKETKEVKKREKRFQKEKMKQERKSKKSYKKINFDGKNSFKNAVNKFVAFIKSPVDTVMNPGEMTWATILILVLFEGIIGGLCVFSAVTGAIRGPIGFLANAMGFKGLHGYEVIKGWLLAALSGALSGVIIFFIYSGIFYIVNRWIIRQFSPYREFVKRFAFVALPATLLGAVGVVFGLFSQVTFTVLLICGLVGSVIITYEILRSVWYMKSPGKIMYIMMACIFVFLLILINFTKFA